MTTGLEQDQPVGRWLAALVVVYVIGHHTGTLLKGLGTVGPTRWADWVDLPLPYLLIGTAAMVLLSAGAGRAAWTTLGIGAVVYAQGHGIHLAANSIGNDLGHARVITLWDEEVGHFVWYLGVAVVVLAVVLGVERIPTGPVAWVLATLFALTLTTNAIEGRAVPLSAALAVLFLARGRHVVIRAAYGAHFVLLVLWVAYWAIAEGRWSPEFTELGWA